MVKADETTPPECSKGHGPMVQRPPHTREQEFCGTWFECAPRFPPCRNSVLIPSPGLLEQLEEQRQAADEFHAGQQVVIIWSGRNAVVRGRYNEHGYTVKPYSSRREIFVRNNEIRARYQDDGKRRAVNQ